MTKISFFIFQIFFLSSVVHAELMLSHQQNPLVFSGRGFKNLASIASDWSEKSVLIYKFLQLFQKNIKQEEEVKKEAQRREEVEITVLKRKKSYDELRDAKNQRIRELKEKILETDSMSILHKNKLAKEEIWQELFDSQKKSLLETSEIDERTVSIAGSDSEPGILEQPIRTGSWVYPQGYMAPGVPGPFAAEPAPTVESTEPVLTTDAPLDLSINKKKLEDLDRLLGKIQAMSSEQIMTQQNLGVRLLHWLAEPNPPTREEGEPRGIADIVSWKLKDPVQKLIDKMSSEQISLQDDNGKTALHIAVESGRDWFVEMLMNKMSAEQISLQDKTGKTALHLGFFKHRMKIIPLLKGRMSKEQIAIVDLEGKTAEELFLHQPFKSEKTASLPVKPAREKNLPVAVVLQIPMVPMLPSVRVGDGSVGNLQVSQRIMMDFNVAESLFNTGSAYVMCGPNADFATAANSFILSAMRYKQVAEGYAALREDIKARQAYLLSAEAYRSASLAYQSAGDQQNSQLALFDARLMSASFAGVSLAPQ